MAQVLLIDDDPGTLLSFGMLLRAAGYLVATAGSGSQAFDVLSQQAIDLVIADLRLPDMSGLDILKLLRGRHEGVPFVMITGFASTPETVAAMRLGAADLLEKPVSEDCLLRSIRSALGQARDARDERDDQPADDRAVDEPPVPHASARLARLIVPVIDSPRDPRTVSDWSRLVFASPGALRNWCRIAGMAPRRSLVFARLLRAVMLGHDGKHKPEDLLDVIDRRTLVGLLRFAGLHPRHEFPSDVETFLQRQVLIRDPDTLSAIRRAIAEHRSNRSSGHGPHASQGREPRLTS